MLFCIAKKHKRNKKQRFTRKEGLWVSYTEVPFKSQGDKIIIETSGWEMTVSCQERCFFISEKIILHLTQYLQPSVNE